MILDFQLYRDFGFLCLGGEDTGIFDLFVWGGSIVEINPKSQYIFILGFGIYLRGDFCLPLVIRIEK